MKVTDFYEELGIRLRQGNAEQFLIPNSSFLISNSSLNDVSHSNSLKAILKPKPRLRSGAMLRKVPKSKRWVVAP